MSKVTIVIKEDNTKKLITVEEKAVKRALEKIGLFVENESKINLTKNGSVKTGNLRNSMTHEVKIGEAAVYVGTNVEYAPYVEYGHRIGTSDSYVSPKPYLKPAVEENRNEINSIIKENLTNA